MSPICVRLVTVTLSLLLGLGTAWADVVTEWNVTALVRATATVGWDGVNYRRIKQIYYGHDRNAAIDVARRHAGEFPLVEVWANGE